VLAVRALSAARRDGQRRRVALTGTRTPPTTWPRATTCPSSASSPRGTAPRAWPRPPRRGTRPLVLAARGRHGEAVAALRRTPPPPRDLLAEALWCLTARAAVDLDDHDSMSRAYEALAPAVAEWGGSSLLTVGPVSRYLDEIASAHTRA